jgi:DNA-binding transcriptional LysR family regulator
MDFHHLRCFVLVAEEMNFRRAADRLGVTQPTVTKRVAALETDLGLDLFVRGENRIVGLTAAGKHYLDDTRRLLSEIESAGRSARTIAEGKGGRLRLGVCEDAATNHFGKSVAAFRQRWPDVEVDILEFPGDHLVRGLQQAEIDLGLVVSPIDDRRLVLDPLWLDEWVVVMPESHGLAAKSRIVISDMAEVGLILADPRVTPGAHEQIRKAFQAGHIAPRVVVQALRRSAILFMVAAGTGVSFAPASFSAALIPGTIARPLAVDPLTVSAAYRALDPPGLALQFLRAAKEVLSKDH